MKRNLFALGALSLTLSIGCSDESTHVSAPEGASSAGRGLPFEAAPSLDMRTYEVTIENLTNDGAQVFSPPVLATHRPAVQMFETGATASDPLAQLAEDGLTDPLVQLLEGSVHVKQVVTGSGPIPPGGSASYLIRSSSAFGRLSAAFMLVNTNDAFSGLSGIRLPREGEEVYMVQAYDAGSEVNTELAIHIPGPCCGHPFAGEDEDDVIRMHDGILGVGDLDPEVYGWKEPVARITVRVVPRTFQVTIENLTPETVAGGSQVFSPPVLATHSPAISMFRVGQSASPELEAIAEDGMTDPMVALLSGSPMVDDVLVGGGPIFPGDSASYEITADRRSARVSLVYMLVNTNDAFSGLDTIFLPTSGSATYYVNAYDAGTEENTELAAHIPGPCCGNVGTGNPTDEPIAMHPGILGIGDLDPEDYGWDEPSAKITVTRIY